MQTGEMSAASMSKQEPAAMRYLFSFPPQSDVSVVAVRRRGAIFGFNRSQRCFSAVGFSRRVHEPVPPARRRVRRRRQAAGRNQTFRTNRMPEVHSDDVLLPPVFLPELPPAMRRAVLPPEMLKSALSATDHLQACGCCQSQSFLLYRTGDLVELQDVDFRFEKSQSGSPNTAFVLSFPSLPSLI